MKKYRHKADLNQKAIVKQLRQIPGVTVELGHDDILIGYKGANYWFDIKNNEKSLKTDHDEKRLDEWKGHFELAWEIDQILSRLNINSERGSND